MPESVSVALCTYNGERYLQQQLDSIANQTRLPDELVIYDDRSSDGTPDIVRRFARTAPFSVEWHCNAHRLGSTLNFNEATLKCQGDIIVLCDQDDVWFPHKLDTLVRHLAVRPGTGLVFSDAHLADDALVQLPGTLWGAFGFTRDQQQRLSLGYAFDTIVRRNMVTGATVAVRKSVLDCAYTFPEIWFHDNWVAVIAAATSDVDFIDEPLMIYRQHASNQIGAKNTSLFKDAKQSATVERSHYLSLATRYEELRSRLEMLNGKVPFENRLVAQIATVSQKIAHLEFRASLDKPAPSRVAAVILESFSGQYFRYSNGVRSIVKDILHRNA